MRLKLFKDVGWQEADGHRATRSLGNIVLDCVTPSDVTKIVIHFHQDQKQQGVRIAFADGKLACYIRDTCDAASIRLAMEGAD